VTTLALVVLLAGFALVILVLALVTVDYGLRESARMLAAAQRERSRGIAERGGAE
jgi:hypothetical protein